MSNIDTPMSERLDELWRELVRMSQEMINPRRADYRDGLFTAYCIMSGMYAEEVYERLQEERS